MLRLVQNLRPMLRPLTVARAQPVRFFASADGFLDAGEVTERVMEVIKNFEKVSPASVTATSHFVDDLGLDSLDTVEVVMAFEDEFCVEIPDEEADKILTTADAVTFITSHPQAK